MLNRRIVAAAVIAGVLASLVPLVSSPVTLANENPPRPDELALCYEYTDDDDTQPDSFRFGVVPGGGGMIGESGQVQPRRAGLPFNVEIGVTDGNNVVVDYSADAALVEALAGGTRYWSNTYTKINGDVEWRVTGLTATANLGYDPANNGGDRLACPAILRDVDASLSSTSVEGAAGISIYDIPASALPAGVLFSSGVGGDDVRDAGRTRFLSRTRFLADPDVASRTRFLDTLIGRTRFLDDPGLISRTRFLDTETISRTRFLAAETIGRTRFLAETISRTRFLDGDGGRVAFISAVPLSSLQPPLGSTWDQVLAGTEFAGSPTTDILFSDVIALCGTEGETESLTQLCESSIFDIDLDGQFLSQVSLISLLFGSTPLSQIPVPNGAPSWCQGGPATGRCGSFTDGDLTLLDLDLLGVDVGALAWSSVQADQVGFSPDSFLGALQAPGEPESLRPLPGETVEDYVVSLLNPEAFPWSEIDVRGLNLARYARGEATTLTTTWTNSGTSGSANVTVQLPPGFDVSGSAQLSVGETISSILPATPVLNVVKFTELDSPAGVPVTLTLDLRPVGLYEGPAGGPVSVLVESGGAMVDGPALPLQVTDPSAAPLPAGLSPADGRLLDFDTLYLFESGDFTADLESGRRQLDYQFDLRDGFPAGSRLSVSLSNLDAGSDLDISLFADVPGALPATDLTYDEQASATGRTRFLAHSRTVGQVQPLDLNTISRTRFLGTDENGDAVVQTESPAESREDVITESDFGALSAVSSNRDDEPEYVEAIVNPALTFQAKVAPYNDLDSGGVMLARAERAPGAAECGVNEPELNASVSVIGPSDARTLILMANDGPVLDATLLEQFRSHAKVNGAIATVDSQIDWRTGDGCSAIIANAVVADISAAVRAQFAGNSSLENIVIVGDHSVLPHAAIPETVAIGKEYTYANEVGGSNATVSAFATGNFFSDAPYGDLDPVLYAGRPVYIEDLAVARLVETPAQIEAQLARFLDPDGNPLTNDSGILDPDSAVVGGYDFLVDNADAVQAGLEKTATVRRMSDVFSTPDWTAAQLQQELRLQPDIVSINGHADHSRILTGKGDLLYRTGQDPDPGESLDSAVTDQVPTPKPGAFHFTVGCHAGLNVPDWTAFGEGAAADRPDDWPEFLGANQVIYWANTGYGYGDEDAVAYSEDLFSMAAEEIGAGGLTIGEAIIRAKSQYASRLNNAVSYDFKVVQQPVLYGLPMWEVLADPPAAELGLLEAASEPAPAEILPALDEETGLMSAALPTALYDWTGITAPTVADFERVVGRVEAKDGLPIVPRDEIDVTAPVPEQYVARGAIIERIDATEASGQNVQYGAVDFGDSAPDPAFIGENVFYPTAFQAMTAVAGSVVGAGIDPEDRLVIYPAQFAKRGEDSAFTLLNEVDATVYYADTSGGSIVDVTAPGIVESSAQVITGAVLFRVIADTDDVVRGVIQYLDDTEWKKVELQPSALNPREWIGQLPNPTNTLGGIYDIQLLDDGGNVGTSRFKGEGYLAEANGLPPSATVVVQTAEGLTILEDEWSTAPLVVRLVGQPGIVEDWSVSAVEELTVEVPETFTPREDLPADGLLVSIAEDGIFRVTYAYKGSTVTIERIVKIDSNAPDITFAPQATVLFPGEEVTSSDVTVTCDDVAADPPGIASGNVPGEGTCSSVEVKENARGQVAATSLDVAGNTRTADQTLVLVDGDGWNPDSGWFTGDGAGTIAVTVDPIGDLAGDITVEYYFADETAENGRGGLVPPDKLPLQDDGRYVVVVLLDGVEISTELVTIGVNIDATPPVIGDAVGLQTEYEVGDDPGTISCTATDATSGLAAACEIEQPSTEVPGVFTITATATDFAGNVATRDFTYTVVAFCDAVDPDFPGFADIVGCRARLGDVDRTAEIVVDLRAPVSDGAQYRLELSVSPDSTGAQVKYSAGKTTGRELISVVEDGSRLTFLIDLDALRLTAGSMLYWSAEVQDGVSGRPAAGFLDRAPDLGYFELQT